MTLSSTRVLLHILPPVLLTHPNSDRTSCLSEQNVLFLFADSSHFTENRSDLFNAGSVFVEMFNRSGVDFEVQSRGTTPNPKLAEAF